MRQPARPVGLCRSAVRVLVATRGEESEFQREDALFRSLRRGGIATGCQQDHAASWGGGRDAAGDRAADQTEWAPRPPVDKAMVKALARAFRWRTMLDKGMHATLEDLARVKGVAPSYVSRILRLTLLAPDIVEAILDGRQPAALQLDDLLEGFPLEWRTQRLALRANSSTV